MTKTKKLLPLVKSVPRFPREDKVDSPTLGGEDGRD